jgi:hypothetical protein
MVAGLKAWEGRCSSTLVELERQIEDVKAKARRRAQDKKDAEEKLDRLLALANAEEGSGEASQGGPGGRRIGGSKNLRPKRPGPPEDEGAEEMDLDEEEEGLAKTRTSRRKL